ncbi:hypothetical protein [Paenibacillus azoreducens]|uniref:Uncharacterized protein n=1 Tax=Paenibacillus azoreducens TaxID=116718 RepID=A0A919Y8B5_9BACL|nr:hypothetical protein [Paenibacillus azoreducens]GIO45674.1 hypothetical protein J34TS1_04390 [Paenibacillus azoreducens]
MLRSRDDILRDITELILLHQQGKLGGEKMPEDEHPPLDPSSAANYHYFTLPMALNYQRNSYALWESAHRTFNDPDTMDVFDPAAAAAMDAEELREKLLKHKVALQPNKQPAVWRTLCVTIMDQLDGDLRNLFRQNGNSVRRIKQHMMQHKKSFPYLGGDKIMNYWLYVMKQYTDADFPDRECITVAPDTHVLQSSAKLGIITEEEAAGPKARELAASRWEEMLQGSGLCPIDIHTPMWLWSRSKFAAPV